CGQTENKACLTCGLHPKSSLVLAASCLSISAAVLSRTLLKESLALLLNCLANLARFSLCSRVTLPLKGRNCIDVCVCVCVRLTSGKLLIKIQDTSRLPGEVRMLRLRVNSSLSALRTAVMSSFTSSRLMMSSTKDELIFTLADWPFALA
uniref:Uncharacterized protein n=1 Tax=Poecilia reticulata TaxID=8081 RepID=A0A3P9NVB3_POERE